MTLCISVWSKMGMLVLACTLPLPAGYFMPVFIYGRQEETTNTLFQCPQQFAHTVYHADFITVISMLINMYFISE